MGKWIFVDKSHKCTENKASMGGAVSKSMHSTRECTLLPCILRRRHNIWYSMHGLEGNLYHFGVAMLTYLPNDPKGYL